MRNIALLLLLVFVSFTFGQDKPKIDRWADLPVDPPKIGDKGDKDAPPPPDGPPTYDGVPSIYGKDIVSENGTIYYVVDISASMLNGAGDYVVTGEKATFSKWDQAKAQLILSIATLPASFKFDIIAYDCSIYEWQPTLFPASPENKKAAITWLNSQTPSGGTGTGPAMTIALMKKEVKLAVLLTDGAPNCGAGSEDQSDPTCLEAHLSQIKCANSQNATVNVFGIGATGVFRTFCITAASQNHGSYYDVR